VVVKAAVEAEEGTLWKGAAVVRRVDTRRRALLGLRGGRRRHQRNNNSGRRPYWQRLAWACKRKRDSN
jgi:hypothetical protein